MVTQEINLNLVPGGVPPVVNVSQYDKGSRVLKLHLYLGTDEYQIPEGTMACIQGTKLDGTGFLYVCEWEGNTVTADVTDQMTVVPGTVKCEAFLQEETEKRIATANFVIVVERATLQDNDHLSETEIPLIGTLAEAALKAMASEKAAKASEENAKDSEDKSKASENAAKNSQEASKVSQDAAKRSEDNAKASEEKSAASEKNAKASETAAQKSEEAAAQSATDLDVAMNNARSYAVGGTGTRDGEDTDNAKYYSQQAKAAKDDAEAAKNAAVESRDAAGQSEQNASASAKSASDSQSAASVSENNVKGSADKAAVSESNAKHSESNAAAYANQAVNAKKGIEDVENKAQSYAVGGTGTRTGEDTDNAKYYASEAKNSAQAGKNMDILEASGSAFVLDNSADAGIHSLTVEGKTTQRKYNGYNLCGGEFINQRWWASTDDKLLDLLNALPVGTYRLWESGEILSVDDNYDATASGSLMYGVAIYANGKQYFSGQVKYPENKKGCYGTASKTFQITDENQGQFTRFYMYTCGASKDGLHGSGSLKVMITAGSDEKTYEPYVGGKPAPNLDYPQDIVSLQNESVVFKSKNIVTNPGPFTFNHNAGPAIISRPDAIQLFRKFYGRKAIVSFDLTTSNDFVTGDRNRFGLENTVKDANHVTYYGAFQLWLRGEELKAGEKKHFSGMLTIGKDVPTDVEIIDVDSVFFYVQCIVSGSITVSNLQIEIADEETSYDTPEISKATIPYTLRSIGDIHDELTVREDGSGELIQRIWHRDLAVADMNNSEDYPGWKNAGIREVVVQKNGTFKVNKIPGYCSIDSDLNGIDMNTMGGNDIVFIGGVLSKLKQAEWKTTYPDLIVSMDFPLITPKITELTPEDVATIMTAQTYNPATVVYASSNESISLQYYNSAVQGGQDQIKRLKASLKAENNRATQKEGNIQKAVDDETKRAGDKEKALEKSIGENSTKLTEQQKALEALQDETVLEDITPEFDTDVTDSITVNLLSNKYFIQWRTIFSVKKEILNSEVLFKIPEKYAPNFETTLPVLGVTRTECVNVHTDGTVTAGGTKVEPGDYVILSASYARKKTTPAT